MSTYIVKSGDTVSGILSKRGFHGKALWTECANVKSDNNLDDKYTIPVGKALVLRDDVSTGTRTNSVWTSQPINSSGKPLTQQGINPVTTPQPEETENLGKKYDNWITEQQLKCNQINDAQVVKYTSFMWMTNDKKEAEYTREVQENRQLLFDNLTPEQADAFIKLYEIKIKADEDTVTVVKTLIQKEADEQIAGFKNLTRSKKEEAYLGELKNETERKLSKIPNPLFSFVNDADTKAINKRDGNSLNVYVKGIMNLSRYYIENIKDLDGDPNTINYVEFVSKELDDYKKQNPKVKINDGIIMQIAQGTTPKEVNREDYEKYIEEQINKYRKNNPSVTLDEKFINEFSISRKFAFDAIDQDDNHKIDAEEQACVFGSATGLFTGNIDISGMRSTRHILVSSDEDDRDSAKNLLKDAKNVLLLSKEFKN